VDLGLASVSLSVSSHSRRSVLHIAIHVAGPGIEQLIGLAADLVRGAVVDAKRVRAASEVNAVLGPGEGLLDGCVGPEPPRTKKRASGPVPARAARRRSWAALMSWHSSTKMEHLVAGGVILRNSSHLFLSSQGGCRPPVAPQSGWPQNVAKRHVPAENIILEMC